MYRKLSSEVLSILVLTLALLATASSLRNSAPTAHAQTSETTGSLNIVDASGRPTRVACPLKHTDVKAEISGFTSRVVVTQEFENNFKEKIEAVYTFPLPQDAAVDDMTMNVGERIVRGKIMRREEAKAVYDAARAGGQVASLLEQERPNIFTQSVANILPGEQIKITISYVETLKYSDGSYEFVFPMVVGPRYIPGTATGRTGGGVAPNTTRVPDASRITPRPAPEGLRAGHDISINVMLDAGVPLNDLSSKSHAVDILRPDQHRAEVRLQNINEIPNKDFVLRYEVAGKKIEDALLIHRDGRGGFFQLILQPPQRVTAEDVTPKELVFVLDTSGSMSGFPIEKAKETMKLALDNLYPYDTFNLITFSGDTNILFPEPVSATKENLQKAQAFLETRQGGGGTEMMKAIKAALDPSDAKGHVRIVCFMTDGYVGNDMEIIAEIKKHTKARVFAFGIGNSVNRFLLDNMARYGRGEVEYVALNDDGSAAARRFHERIRNPLLTNLSLDWGGLPVTDIYPKEPPDLFGAKPVIINGRFTAAGSGVVHLKGIMSGQPFTRDITIEFPESETKHDVLATLWARTRVDDLMSQDFGGAQSGNMNAELKNTITNLGIEYRLMTQFTSFVAVEEVVVTDGGEPRRVEVPIDVPEGVDRAAANVGNGFAMQAFAGQRGRGPVSMAYLMPSNMRPSGTLSNPTAPSSVTVAAAKPDTSTTSATDKPLIDPSASISGRPPAKRATVLNGKSSVVGSASGGGSGSGVGSGMAAGAGDYANKPEDEARQKLLAKFDPVVLAVIDRLIKKDTRVTAGEATFVRNGNAEIQIWLDDKSEATMLKLAELGFQVVLDPKSAKFVIGRLPVDKLPALVDFKSIRYVGPQLKPL
jgi:Ca-activated chloride channel family protein